MGGGNSNQSTAAKVWQNQKYEDFITAAVVSGEDSGGGFIAERNSQNFVVTKKS